ncbi:MAG: MBL fold metallo-hydrolase, partial [Anaerotardibacter sp.]
KNVITEKYPSSDDGVPSFYKNKTPMFPKATYQCVEYFNEIFPNIYRCTFEIENFPFAKRLMWHCVVEPGKQALFVDCGWWELCGVKMLDEVVTRFNIPWENIDIFITHFHEDHDGNLAYCLNQGVRNVFHGPRQLYQEKNITSYLRATGSAQANDFEFIPLLELFHGKNIVGTPKAFKQIQKQVGKTIEIAGYSFDTLFTPGHTTDHICLIEREKGILFAGDHITDSAPGVLKVDLETPILLEYLDSLESLKKANLNYVLMSHDKPLVGTEEINAFLEKMIRKCDKPFWKSINILAMEKNPISMYKFSTLAENHRPGGYLAQTSDVRGRRLMYNYSFVDYLEHTGKVAYTEDDNGVRLYQLKQI